MSLSASVTFKFYLYSLHQCHHHLPLPYPPLSSPPLLPPPSVQGRVFTVTSFASPLPGETLACPEKNVLGFALADELPVCHKSSPRFSIKNLHHQWHCESRACHAPAETQMWSFFFSRYPVQCSTVFNGWVNFKKSLFISPVK